MEQKEFKIDSRKEQFRVGQISPVDLLAISTIIDFENLHELRSSSKLLVAMAIGIAIENNLFSLEEKVYNYLEKYITNDNNKDKIKKWTIRTLLTHTTGYDKMLMSNKEIIEKNLDKSKLL